MFPENIARNEIDPWQEDGTEVTRVALKQPVSPPKVNENKSILLTWSVYHSATRLSNNDGRRCHVPAV